MSTGKGVSGGPASVVNHIHSLDGIRAVAVLIVFVAHAGLPVLVNGSTGVTLFFFLSGFLITTLLRAEYGVSGSVSFRNFYARRIIRIWPPMYAAIVCAIVARSAGLVGGPEVSFGGLMAQLMHVTNYWILFEGRDGLIEPTLALWSLSVEEHFYLIFPLVFIGLLIWRSRRTQVATLLALSALVLLWRLVLDSNQAGFDRLYLATDTRIDSILWGCLLAVACNPVLDEVPGRTRHWQATGMMAAALFWVTQAAPPGFAMTWGLSIEGALLCIIFIAILVDRGSAVAKLLNYRPIAYLGTISYAFYLFHELAIALVAEVGKGAQVAQAVVAFVLTVLFAVVVRQTIEKPLQRLRKRFVSGVSSSPRVAG